MIDTVEGSNENPEEASFCAQPMQSSTVRGVINLGAHGIELPFHLSE